MLSNKLLSFLKSNTNLFFRFYKNPKQIQNNENNKLNILLYCFFLQCCLTILDLSNLAFFQYLEKAKFLGNLKLVITENPVSIKFKSQTVFFNIACFVGPLLEEIIYRLPLLKKYNFLIFLPLISFFFYSTFGFSFALNCGVFLLLIGSSIIYYRKANYESNNLRHIIYNYKNLYYGTLYPLLFYAMALFFAFSHIENYYWCTSNIVSGSLLIGTIFISHIIFGYTLLNCGFWYAVLLHGLNNIIVSLIP